MVKGNEEQKSILRVLQKERKKKNALLNMFLFIYAFGYLIFLTSNSWYPTHSDMVEATEFYKEYQWNDRKVILDDWDYSENQQLMEIKIEIQNTSFDGVDKYEYEALDRKKGYFEVKPVLEDEDYVVLHIIGVNKNWSEISLRISMPEKKEKGSTEISALKLYTNVEKVNTVQKIKDKSENQYYAERINEKIQNYEDIISELTEENLEYQSKIKQAKENISRLDSEKEYQTEKEIKETEEQISKAKMEIETMQTDVNANNEEIEEYQERIKNSEEELKQYQ